MRASESTLSVLCTTAGFAVDEQVLAVLDAARRYEQAGRAAESGARQVDALRVELQRAISAHALNPPLVQMLQRLLGAARAESEQARTIASHRQMEEGLARDRLAAARLRQRALQEARVAAGAAAALDLARRATAELDDVRRAGAGRRAR